MTKRPKPKPADAKMKPMEGYCVVSRSDGTAYMRIGFGYTPEQAKRQLLEHCGPFIPSRERIAQVRVTELLPPRKVRKP